MWVGFSSAAMSQRQAFNTFGVKTQQQNWSVSATHEPVAFGVNAVYYWFDVWQLELTPPRQGELEHVSAEVRREDLHNAQVHVQRLQARPGEGGQQEVVQEGSCAYAQRRDRVARQPRVQ